jgi:hypothetical protein
MDEAVVEPRPARQPPGRDALPPLLDQKALGRVEEGGADVGLGDDFVSCLSRSTKSID